MRVLFLAGISVYFTRILELCVATFSVWNRLLLCSSNYVNIRRENIRSFNFDLVLLTVPVLDVYQPIHGQNQQLVSGAGSAHPVATGCVLIIGGVVALFGAPIVAATTVKATVFVAQTGVKATVFVAKTGVKATVFVAKTGVNGTVFLVKAGVGCLAAAYTWISGGDTTVVDAADLASNASIDQDQLEYVLTHGGSAGEGTKRDVLAQLEEHMQKVKEEGVKPPGLKQHLLNNSRNRSRWNDEDDF
jgi:hypothetical protein